MPATPDNTITPRREIKNYQIKSLINLRYTALGLPPTLSSDDVPIVDESSARAAVTEVTAE